MATILPTCSLYYRDINLIGQPQDHVRSRMNDIPRAVDKIVVAPMAAVVGTPFALEAVRLDLSVCLPRFCTVATQKRTLNRLRDEFGRKELEQWHDVWVAVGLDDWERVETLEHNSVLVDVANGYLSSTTRFVRQLQDKGYRVMAGNVHSAKGLNLYHDCRVRVGIGNGSVCQTNEVTGYNRGQVTEIIECVEGRYSADQQIIADGGIASAGEAAKAFGLGADYVMMGGYFSRAEEAENIRKGEYRYWGGASETQQIKHRGRVTRHSEGRETAVNKKNVKPLKTLVDDLWGGIASAISYSGHANLEQFRGNGVFEVRHG
jgi:GMP reductase